MLNIDILAHRVADLRQDVACIRGNHEGDGRAVGDLVYFHTTQLRQRRVVQRCAPSIAVRVEHGGYHTPWRE